jgi:hypothetical protein
MKKSALKNYNKQLITEQKKKTKKNNNKKTTKQNKNNNNNICMMRFGLCLVKRVRVFKTMSST